MKCTLKHMLYFVFFLLLLPISQTMAEDYSGFSLGVRSGFSATSKDPSFESHQAYFTTPLPWRWQGPDSWQILTDLKGTAGVLKGGDESAFVGSAGAGLALESPSGKLSIQMSIRLQIIGEDRFENKDFGGPVQAVEDLGITFRPIKQVEIGYRIEHMSNGNLYDRNPGLNLHFFEIGYRF